MAEVLPDCETRLLEARIALHKLATGTAEVSVGYGDRSVTFRAANIDQLRVYIRELEQECGGETKRRQPFRVVW
jgi:signal recognition particle GTPase